MTANGEDLTLGPVYPTTAGVELFWSGEVMTATPNFASDPMGAQTGGATAPAASAGPFVLNLCSSTAPMALVQTDLPELRRFTFFVSPRFEEGRARFRLHMGYFATLAEAEKWLGVVRTIYPGAWVGETPGRRRRERAAAQGQHAAAGPEPQARAAVKPVFEDSNVREVLQALGDASTTGDTRPMRPPPPRETAADSASMSDAQVLKLLAARRRPPTTEPTGRSEALNGSGVRHLRARGQRNSPFSKLFERLSGGLRKPQA